MKYLTVFKTILAAERPLISSSGVTKGKVCEGGDGPPTVTPFTGGDTRPKIIFVAEFIKKTLDIRRGEDGSGEETTAKKVIPFRCDD